jgi:hypothetical protein
MEKGSQISGPFLLGDLFGSVRVGNVMKHRPYESESVLKRYEDLQHQDDEKDHSLQEHAKERAKHPEHLNAGTPYDWEDVDRYREELERMDKEGPSLKNPTNSSNS